METNALVRLEPLALIAPERVPRDRRQAEQRCVLARKAAADQVTGSALLTIYLGIGLVLFVASVIYGMLAIMPAAVECVLVVCATFTAGATGYEAGQLVQALRKYRLAAPSQRQRLEAAAEQSLSDAAFRLNGQVADWNASASLAHQIDVDDRYRTGLIVGRERLAARLLAFEDQVKRYRLATAPKPKELTP